MAAPDTHRIQLNELRRYKSEAEKQRESHERRETHHLAEYVELTARLVAKAHQDRLRHLRHHALYERETLGVPLVSLIVVARIAGREIMSQENIQHIVVDAGHDGGCKNLA